MLIMGFGFAAASALPLIALLLICPVAMFFVKFFMMRGMNGRPR